MYGTSFGVENVRKLEEMVSKAIAAKDDVERKICDSADALSREEVRKACEEIYLILVLPRWSQCQEQPILRRSQ